MAVIESWNFNKKTSEIVSSVKLNVESQSQEQSLDIDTKFVLKGTSDYTELENLPTINGSPIIGDYLLGEGLAIADKTISVADGIVKRVRVATTAQWNVEPTYTPGKGQIIIYSDYATVGTTNYSGVKIGDGTTYIVDLPFLCGELKSSLESHVSDALAHVSAEDREYWNNKNKVSEVVVNEVLEITL